LRVNDPLLIWALKKKFSSPNKDSRESRSEYELRVKETIVDMAGTENKLVLMKIPYAFPIVDWVAECLRAEDEKLKTPLIASLQDKRWEYIAGYDCALYNYILVGPEAHYAWYWFDDYHRSLKSENLGDEKVEEKKLGYAEGPSQRVALTDPKAVFCEPAELRKRIMRQVAGKIQYAKFKFPVRAQTFNYGKYFYEDPNTSLSYVTELIETIELGSATDDDLKHDRLPRGPVSVETAERRSRQVRPAPPVAPVQNQGASSAGVNQGGQGNKRKEKNERKHDKREKKKPDLVHVRKYPPSQPNSLFVDNHVETKQPLVESGPVATLMSAPKKEVPPDVPASSEQKITGLNFGIEEVEEGKIEDLFKDVAYDG